MPTYIKFTWINEGDSSGPVTSFNRDAIPGETQNLIDTTQIIWGYVPELYKVKNGAFEPLEQEEVDEYNTEVARDAAMVGLMEYYNSLIAEQGLSDPTTTATKEAKLTRTLRKESKGTANPGDIQLLDDNDTLDTWYDDLEIARESQGEAYLEDPARTEEELNAFDPATDVTWPPYPL